MDKFTKDSALVTFVWVPLILDGVYEFEDVPELSNLKEIVREVLMEKGYFDNVSN